MRCETCNGTGKMMGLDSSAGGAEPDLPCVTCGGTGVDHCCSGDCYPLLPTDHMDRIKR